jgi:outer membrane protein OmpA-like peptidoglycan-associated protein
MYRGLRVFLSPYFSLQAGTNNFNDFGSSQNLIFARLGLSVKSSFDEKKYDTLKFNPSFKQAPKAIARINERGINVPQTKQFIAAALPIEKASPPKENIAPVTSETPTVEVTEKVSPTEAPQKKLYSFKVGEEKVFNYPTSSATSISQDMRDYLDELAEFMKSNPNVRVRIQGHSDGTGGSPEINMKRSEDRANAINRYLRAKNIPQSRLFPVGYGNTKPLASERTEEGRRINRRVEIIIEK